VGRPAGRRGRCGHPRSLITHLLARRGVEQWQLVGLITQRSEVRILPPPPLESITYKNITAFACAEAVFAVQIIELLEESQLSCWLLATRYGEIGSRCNAWEESRALASTREQVFEPSGGIVKSS
jgi:hypothetical protein